jgi:H+-translocating NAD(P) transhydrogenase subunit beta
VSYRLILAGIVVGASVGALFAMKVQMTAMPQMVALFNGFGGGASVLVAGAALIETAGLLSGPLLTQVSVATVASGIIGTVTFWGSLVAFGKLQGLVTEKSVELPGHQAANVGLLLLALALGAWTVARPLETGTYWGIVAAASVLGVMLVLPIGGADMPVVISLLNSYSGLAAAATGFVLSNNVLIIAGSLVGASGMILTQIMCRAMNRSLANVLFGGALEAAGAGGPTEEEVYAGKVKSATADEVAMLFDAARRVVIVPGYGLAVSQAQHLVRDLTLLLESRKIVVEYAIHPVAGRMPGHMNVLLAEADIPYEKLKEMDEINPTLERFDVALVVGANDVVNPVALTDPSSPIAGMPIIEVHKSRTVVVIKRSLSPGFAGIPNPLFAADNTLMFFGDGQKALLDLIASLKSL